MNFEEIARKLNVSILHIKKDGIIVAQGVYIPDAILTFEDGNKSSTSYSDTGIFVLFKGSRVYTTDTKYKKYINSNQEITKELVFQSRNAAAKFVLGTKGRTNAWEEA